ncbi:hypothetical protein P615_08240 [Brevibacillus laterosporus PE36]|nr:hypothetical protein P615_08240 [Brevibacillus laterosporus PE36]
MFIWDDSLEVLSIKSHLQTRLVIRDAGKKILLSLFYHSYTEYKTENSLLEHDLQKHFDLLRQGIRNVVLPRRLIFYIQKYCR